MKIIEKKYKIKDNDFYGIEIALPKTNLLIIGNEVGFVMCGALDVDIYNSSKLVERGVICGKAIGVKTLEDLLQAEIFEASLKAKEIGWQKGVKIIDALNLII